MVKVFARLAKYERNHGPIRVALVGAGSMGRGIAWQLRRSPGLQLAVICDRNPNASSAACAAYGLSPETGKEPDAEKPIRVVTDHEALNDVEFDVLVEATNTIGFAARVCEQALQRKQHVVLMNAEVDLALGPWLHRLAEEHGVVLTSDAGDQHGVLLRMLDEIRLWAFRPVMAGNIKGFLNRYATADTLQHEAQIRRLNPVQCCAYTDGTKLSVEMALVANATGMLPHVTGMEGPQAEDVLEVLHKFDFNKYPESGVVDYILGARPGGGVFVVGHCDDPLQTPYLQYYKLGDGPYYLFYRPYHLCHLETPWAIASAVLDHEAILAPVAGRTADVYAFAKRDLSVGDKIHHAIGGSECYGMIDRCVSADAQQQVPVALLEVEEGDRLPTLTRPVQKDQPLTWDDLAIGETDVMRLFHVHVCGSP